MNPAPHTQNTLKSGDNASGASTPRLYCEGGGCTAKLGPEALNRVLSKLERRHDPDLLVGYEHADDAAVYRLSHDMAVVQTLDFFPPMVEDPYIYGQIAAVNALSDIFAMGADFKVALNIVSFPKTEDLNILGRILEGGAQKVAEAGGSLAGGHSIAQDKILYGLSATGVVHPDQVLRNTAVQNGDVLILSKALGVGTLCAAHRAGLASARDYQGAINSMLRLNRQASELARAHHATACTDVTGFGLLVHLSELLGPDHGARIELNSIPILSGALDALNAFCITEAAQRNRRHIEQDIDFGTCDFARAELLFDPQTSGGLLISVGEANAPALLAALQASGHQAAIFGRISAHAPSAQHRIILH